MTPELVFQYGLAAIGLVLAGSLGAAVVGLVKQKVHFLTAMVAVATSALNGVLEANERRRARKLAEVARDAVSEDDGGPGGGLRVIQGGREAG